jgi:hypothetical protein
MLNFTLFPHYRYLGTTPDSSSLAPLLTSICQQLSYTFMLPFEDIPDDLVPLTAHMKELLNQGRHDSQFEISRQKGALQIGRAHTTGENGKWGETKQRSENQVVFNSVLGPS